MTMIFFKCCKVYDEARKNCKLIFMPYINTFLLLISVGADSSEVKFLSITIDVYYIAMFELVKCKQFIIQTF
jgi:hypothetical protein